MSQMLTESDELASDLVACQLVIKQILDVIEVIDFNQPGIDAVTQRGVQKAIALIELKFNRQDEVAAH